MKWIHNTQSPIAEGYYYTQGSVMSCYWHNDKKEWDKNTLGKGGYITSWLALHSDEEPKVLKIGDKLIYDNEYILKIIKEQGYNYSRPFYDDTTRAVLMAYGEKKISLSKLVEILNVTAIKWKFYSDKKCDAKDCYDPVIGDYNGHGCFVCEYHMKKYNDYFDEEYR